MLKSNEQYERVTNPENGTTALGLIGTNIAKNVAAAAALEGVLYAGAKKVSPSKNPGLSQLFQGAAFYEHDGKNKFVQYLTAGTSTKKGRIANYGASVGVGLINGLLEHYEPASGS